MAGRYTFRMDSSEVEALKKALESIGPAGEAALAKIRAAAPGVADALAAATRNVDLARERIAGRGGIGAAFEQFEGQANRARGVARDLAGTLELLGVGSNAASQRVSQVASVIGNVADTAATLALTLGRAHPALIGLATAATVAAGAYALFGRGTEDLTRQTQSYREAVDRLNASLADQAELQRRAEVQRLSQDAGAVRTELERRIASEARARQSLENAEAAAARTGDPRAAERAVQARQQLELLSGAVAQAREQLAAIDAQIRSVATGLGRMGDAAAQAGGQVAGGVGAIVARLQTPRERIDQQYEQTVLDLARARERGAFANPAYQGPAYDDLVTRATRERTEALRELARTEAERARAAGRDADERQRVTDAIAQQTRGIAGETRGLELNDRQRAISTELQRAEETARRDVQRVVRTGNAMSEEEARLIGGRTALTEGETRAIIDNAGARFDLTRAREAERRAAQETERAIGRSTDRVVDFAADAFDRILQGGSSSFKKLWDDFVGLSRKAFAQAAAEAWVRPIVQPVMAQVVGAFGNVFGGGSAAQGTSGGIGGGTVGGSSGGGFQMPSTGGFGSLFSGGSGSLAPGLDAWAFRNFGFGQIDNFAGQGAGAMGPFQAPGLINGGSWYGGFQSLGNILGIAGAALPGLLSGNYAQAGLGVGGAALGTILLPGIGTAIGGTIGNLIGSLFGKRPSAPPTSFAGIGVDLGLGGSLTETWRNGGSESNRRVPDYGPAGQMRLVVQDALKQIQAAVGAKITGGRYAQGSLNYYTVGDTQSYVSYVNDGRGGSAALPTAEAAVRDFLSRVVPGLTFDGDARRAQLTTIASHGADKLEDLLTRLGQAKQFQDAYDALTDTQDALSATAQQLKTLADQVDTLRDSAAEFGYTVAEIDAGYQQKLAKVRSDFDQAVQDQILGLTDPQAAALRAWEKERDQAVKDAGLVGGNIVEVERLYALKREAVIKASLGNIDTALRSWLDGQVFGAASSSSPATRLGEAQRMFGEQIAAARGGDAAAIGGITGYANQLLASARDYYASSPEFAAIEAMTRSSIAGLGRALGLPGFATGGDFTVRGSGGTDSQVVAFRATPGERVSIRTPGQVASGGGGDQVVAALRQEMTAMRRDFRMLTHLLAMGRSA